MFTNRRCAIAEPISFDEIMQMEDIPEGFEQVKVTYIAEDEVISEEYVPYGYMLKAEQFPVLEDREEAYVQWPDLENYASVTGNIILDTGNNNDGWQLCSSRDSI